MRHGRRATALLALGAAALLSSEAGCARNRRRQADGQRSAEAFDYRVEVEPSLARMDVELCFHGATPSALRPGKAEGAERLEYARWLRPGAVRRLPIANGRIHIDEPSDDGCIGYGLKLSEGGALGASIRRVGGDLVASPDVWLFRPERIGERVHARLQLTLPDGVRALLPWPEQNGARELDAAAFRFDSYGAFGRFEPLRAQHRGVDLELALLEGPLAIDGASALRWLRGAIDMIAESAGSFPTRRVSVIVVPVSGGGDPVPFGMVARGGEASLLLLVSAEAGESALARDWVVPHELSHLLIPFVEREHAWLSEGLATYYQEVLRARAGIFDERTLWTRFARYLREVEGAESDASLLSESARMHETHAYRRVYWGGAAYWLCCDVAVREATEGRHTLDSLLAELRRDGASLRPWKARELLARLDGLSGTEVFGRRFAELEQRAFPDYEPTLAALGVNVRASDVVLDDAAPLASIRRALTSAR